MLCKEDILPAVMILSPTSTRPTQTPAKDTSQTHPNPLIDVSQCVGITMLKIAKPATQRYRYIPDDVAKTVSIRSFRFPTKCFSQLFNTLLSGPTPESSLAGRLKVVSQKVEAFHSYVHDFGLGWMQGQAFASHH